jgi:hypothetical protein
LGSKLVQGCKRVKEQGTSKRSQFTDVVRKSTSAILVDPKNVGDDYQSDEENDDPQEMDDYNTDLERVKKRNSKGGYILGEFTIFPKKKGYIKTQLLIAFSFPLSRCKTISSTKGCRIKIRS